MIKFGISSMHAGSIGAITALGDRSEVANLVFWSQFRYHTFYDSKFSFPMFFNFGNSAGVTPEEAVPSNIDGRSTSSRASLTADTPKTPHEHAR